MFLNKFTRPPYDLATLEIYISFIRDVTYDKSCHLHEKLDRKKVSHSREIRFHRIFHLPL